MIKDKEKSLLKTTKKKKDCVHIYKREVGEIVKFTKFNGAQVIE